MEKTTTLVLNDSKTGVPYKIIIPCDCLGHCSTLIIERSQDKIQLQLNLNKEMLVITKKDEKKLKDLNNRLILKFENIIDLILLFSTAPARIPFALNINKIIVSCEYIEDKLYAINFNKLTKLNKEKFLYGMIITESMLSETLEALLKISEDILDIPEGAYYED